MHMQLDIFTIQSGLKRVVQIAGTSVAKREDLVQHFVALMDIAAERDMVTVQWGLLKLLQSITHVLKRLMKR